MNSASPQQPVLPKNLADLLIQQPLALRELCKRLRSARRFAFDTEFIRERTYQPRLCLIQVAGADGSLGLIDPLRLSAKELQQFWELVADPAIETVVHAGRQDLEIGVMLSGLSPTGIFDVQVAAGLSGHPYPMSLTRLTEALLRVRLVGGETVSDWAARPLSAEQLRYAVEDVMHLLEMQELLTARLTASGRLGWLREECVRLLETTAAEMLPSMQETEEPWRRVRGKGTLTRRGLAVLRELADWREQLARVRDVPVRSLLRDDVLVELARRRPETAADLRSIRIFPRSEIDRSAADICAAVQRGLDVPDEQCPSVPSEDRDERGHPEAKPLSDLLSAVGATLCQQAGVAHELFAGRADYLELAEAHWRSRLAEAVGVSGPQSGTETATSSLTETATALPIRAKRMPKLLTGWRGAFAGRTLGDVITGRVSIRVMLDGRQPKLDFQTPSFDKSVHSPHSVGQSPSTVSL